MIFVKKKSDALILTKYKQSDFTFFSAGIRRTKSYRVIILAVGSSFF
jgi:hypothetical protein